VPELVVIGLDALDPFYLQKWVEKGYLPTFEKLIENGVFGKLESTIPPVTLPAWPAMFTGKNPGKLGVFDFFDIQKVGKGYTFRPFSPIRWRGSYVWDILGAFGKKTGLINFPELFTSYELNGFMVNVRHGFSACPKRLENELETIVPNFERHIKEPFKSIKNIEKNTFLEWEVNKYLRSKFSVDLFIHIFSILDVVLHHTQNEEELKNQYMKVDKQLGEYLDSYKDKNLLIVSDHGTGKFSKKFYMNSYLKEKGDLELKSPNFNKSFIRLLPYSLANIFPSLEKIFVRLSEFFGRFTKENLMPSLEELFSSVDWALSKTFAYALSTSNFVGLWLLKNDIGIIERILEFEDPENRKKVVKRVFRKEEIYWGPALSNLPDVVAELNEEYLATSEISPLIFCRTKVFAHRRYGTFIAYGDDFKKNMSINEAEIVDVAPTILHMMNVPIPQDVDGKVLKDIFRSGSDFLKRKIKRRKPLCRKGENFRLSKEDEEVIKKRLRSLGYF